MTATLHDAAGGRPGAYRAAPGEFIGEGQWKHEDGLVREPDFRSDADRDTWGWTSVPDGGDDPFDATVTAPSEELKRSRRRGLTTR